MWDRTPSYANPQGTISKTCSAETRRAKNRFFRVLSRKNGVISGGSLTKELVGTAIIGMSARRLGVT